MIFDTQVSINEMNYQQKAVQHAFDHSKSYADVAFPYAEPTEVFRATKGIKRTNTLPIFKTVEIASDFDEKMNIVQVEDQMSSNDDRMTTRDSVNEENGCQCDRESEDPLAFLIEQMEEEN